MSDYFIDATRKDGPDLDYRIDAFLVNGRWYTIEEMLAFIRDGHRFFVEVSRQTVEVLKRRHPRTQREYLTTEADGFPPNNLLRLPDN